MNFQNSDQTNQPVAALVPVVVEQVAGGERSYDLISRLMKDRAIFLDGAVTQISAQIIIKQLLFLDNQSNEPIDFYINSEGGMVIAGIAIEDTMNAIKSPIRTVATGMAMSMGAYLLSAGTHRMATEGARIMCHQVSSGIGRSTLADMRISLKETELLDAYLAQRLAANCGMSVEDYKKITDRDHFMSAEEGLAFGIIDEIVPTVAKEWPKA